MAIEDINYVEVCVELDGQLDRQVIVEFTASSNSAQGMLVMYMVTY